MIYKDVIFLRADGTPDSSGDHFAVDSQIECREELNVWSKPCEQLLIGLMKNIRRIDSLFIGDLHTYTTTPLSHEILKWLVPTINGFILKRDGPDNKILKHIKITRIDLDPWNADKRIKNLGSYENVDNL